LNTIAIGLIQLVQDSSIRKTIVNKVMDLAQEDTSIYFFEINQLLLDSLNINIVDIATSSILENYGNQNDVDNFICSVDSFLAYKDMMIFPKLIIQNIARENKSEIPIIANAVQEIGTVNTLTNTTWNFKNDFIAMSTVLNEAYMDNNYIWIVTYGDGKEKELPSVIKNPPNPNEGDRIGDICSCWKSDENGRIITGNLQQGCAAYQLGMTRCGKVTGGKGTDGFAPGCWGGGCGRIMSINFNGDILQGQILTLGQSSPSIF